jgi:hypothetical protein
MAGLRNAGFRSVKHSDVVPRDDVIEAPKEKKEADKTDQLRSQ